MMTKSNNASFGSFFRELLAFDLYKRSQGRMIRQVTGIVLGIGFLLAAWQTYLYWQRYPTPSLVAATIIGLGGLWLSFRVVNYPRFADFLIATEAELNKVSWPTSGELFRGSVVVLLVMFALAGILYAYDILWFYVLQLLRVIPVQ